MRRRNSWDRRYAMPTDVHSSDELASLARFAVTITALAMILGLARVAISYLMVAMATMLVVVQP